MRDRGAGRLAWGLLALSLLFVAAGAFVLLISLDVARPRASWGPRGFPFPVGLAFSIVGTLIARRHPTNPIGWLYLATGTSMAALGFADEYALHVVLGDGGDLPFGAWGAWFVNWAWLPSVATSLVYAVLLFPDGRLPSTAARWIAVGSVPIFVFTSGLQMLGDYPIQGYAIPNPAGVLPISEETASSLLSLMVISVVAAQVVLVRRLRRSTGTEREQIKWVVLAEVFAGVAMTSNLVGVFGGPPWTAEAAEWLSVTGLLAIPVAAGIAILRLGLFGIETIISRSVLFLGLSGFVTAAYSGLVLGIGALLQRTGEPNHIVSIGAAVVVALAFQPVRERMHRFADRVAYGTRAEPYEVLAEVGEQMRSTADAEALLHRLAQSLTDGTGAASTTIWLRVLDELLPTASHPPASIPTAPVALADGLDALPGDRVEAVEHDGELLGAISLTKRYADPLPPAEDRLVRDLAGHAGLLLRNLRLTAELQRHVEELRESRQRLVSAQDAERRRLERDLHDGAQQQLVAVKVKLGLARLVAGDEGAATTAGTIDELTSELTEAIATLRELAHGIYPPRLAADGLVAALLSHAAKSIVPVEVTGDVGRYPADLEAAVYFCCLEALQNVNKYAEASRVHIELEERPGFLTFTIVDDGRGFDPNATALGVGLTNMRDRVEAQGGTLSITSTVGRGTAITGALPVGVQEDHTAESATFRAHV